VNKRHLNKKDIQRFEEMVGKAKKKTRISYETEFWNPMENAIMANTHAHSLSHSSPVCCPYLASLTNVLKKLG